MRCWVHSHGSRRLGFVLRGRDEGFILGVSRIYMLTFIVVLIRYHFRRSIYTLLAFNGPDGGVPLGRSP